MTRPKVVLFSDVLGEAIMIPLSIRSIAAALGLAHLARERFPGLPVVYGPGEDAIVALSRAILTGATDESRLRSIPNLAFRRGGELVVTPRKTIKNFNDLAPVHYSLVPIESHFTKDHRTIQYVRSYGCPYARTFCAEPDQSASRGRGLHPERVVDEISQLFERYAAWLIAFVGPNFSANPYRVVAFVEERKRRRLSIPMAANTRAPDVVRIEQRIDLSELLRVGFKTVFSGVESGSDRIVEMLKKGSPSRTSWRRRPPSTRRVSGRVGPDLAGPWQSDLFRASGAPTLRVPTAARAAAEVSRGNPGLDRCTPRRGGVERARSVHRAGGRRRNRMLRRRTERC